MAFELFVNGTLMRGLTLHPNMGNSLFLGEFRTVPHYRLHTINNIHPGMYRLEEDESGGVAVRGELYLVEDEVWRGRLEARLTQDEVLCRVHHVAHGGPDRDPLEARTACIRADETCHGDRRG